MANIKDYHVGQTVYEYDFELSNRKFVREATVKHIGRKYVTLEGSWGHQYYASDCKSEPYLIEKTIYSPKSYLFPNKDSLNDYLNDKELNYKIVFGRFNTSALLCHLTYEQKLQILEWIGEHYERVDYTQKGSLQ